MPACFGLILGNEHRAESKLCAVEFRPLVLHLTAVPDTRHYRFVSSDGNPSG